MKMFASVHGGTTSLAITIHPDETIDCHTAVCTDESVVLHGISGFAGKALRSIF